MLGREKLVASGIVEKACDQFFATRQRDRNAEDGIAMRKVRGAVERIDEPAILGVEVRPGAFFAQDAEFRPARSQSLGDEFFRSAIGLGDQVNIALVFVANVPPK